MKKPSALILAHRAGSPVEAEIVRSLLENAGLFVTIPDKNTPIPIDLTPGDGEYSITGCDVLVRREELAKATEVIRDARESGRLESESEMDVDYDDADDADDDDPDADDDE